MTTVSNENSTAPMRTLKSEESYTAAEQLDRQRWRNVALHDRCSMRDMLRIKEAFQMAHNNKMTRLEFREVLTTLMGLEYDDENFNIMFLKINTSRTGEIDWDEMVSHLILGYFGCDVDTHRKALQLPIIGLPIMLRSHHRNPISRICFCPDVDKDRKTDPMQGSYVTVSRDGMVHWWSLDMKITRTAQSTCPYLRVNNTWVTDMVCMPDVNIIVTSSTERDLRFYDCIAKTFTLKIVITGWLYMVCTMYYHFAKDANEECMLICGDVAGNVRVLVFTPANRPFQSDSGRSVITLRYVDLRKRSYLLPQLQLVELNNLHTEWVRQVSYYESLHCVVSCATCNDALLMCDMQGSKTHNMFKVEKGIQCFAFDEEVHVLVTGGPDCVVRVWNSFVPVKPMVTFEGHRAGIVHIVLQEKGNIIYSLSRDRNIRVWDVQAFVCVQSYIDIPSVLGERSPISVVYNPATRYLIMACVKIAIITLDEQVNPLHTDGSTHSRAVSKVLYNPLFKIIITCGMDSIIINWDPITGNSNLIIRDVHTQQVLGELIPVEITAATFDSGYQMLLTGARHGELKIWNFNTGDCIKTLWIQYMCEVTGVFWVEDRILAMGWDRKVTEFEASGLSVKGKSWELRHTDDIMAAAVRPPLTLATATYNSEMVLWKLDTGQPYRLFSCTDPTQRIKMIYKKRNRSPNQTKTEKSHKKSLGLRKPKVAVRDNISPSVAVQKARARPVATVPSREITMRHLAVQAMIFLETRQQHPEVASFCVSLENGVVQGWSDHSAGGYQGSFQAIHIAGDYVSCMATDLNNEFLFTGTTVGYLKVWLMTNVFDNETVHINMPRLRLMFPFLWRDRVEGRAKRCVRDQPKPLLLNSYRAHMRCINTVAYFDELKLVCTGSSDYSVRLWRLSGEYLQTLGSFVPWTLEVTRIPPDVKKCASSTTLKVFNGGVVSRFVPGQKVVDKLSDITAAELKRTFGAPPDEPLLGHYFELPPRPDRQDPIQLDTSLPRIPMYAHLRMASTVPVRRPPTPELVRKTQVRMAQSHRVTVCPSTRVSKTTLQLKAPKKKTNEAPKTKEIPTDPEEPDL